MRVYARTEPGAWSPVLEHGEEGCRIQLQHRTFEEVWNAEPSSPPTDAASVVFRPWESLLTPLPLGDIPCWAYAMTYATHRKEVKRKTVFRFPKDAPAQMMNSQIPYRQYLDYEAEVGILLHRTTPNRFGFFMLNDLTDRSIQVLGRARTPKQRAASYTQAKSFEGALLVGPLIAIGEKQDWGGLEIDLQVNGALRQRVRALECCLDPATIHKELFSSTLNAGWLLAATGTAEGIMLKVPSLLQKIDLLRQSRLSGTRARKLHLSRQQFLQPGDELVMSSPTLGYNRTVIKANE